MWHARLRVWVCGSEQESHATWGQSETSDWVVLLSTGRERPARKEYPFLLTEREIERSFWESTPHTHTPTTFVILPICLIALWSMQRDGCHVWPDEFSSQPPPPPPPSCWTLIALQTCRATSCMRTVPGAATDSSYTTSWCRHYWQVKFEKSNPLSDAGNRYNCDNLIPRVVDTKMLSVQILISIKGAVIV